MPRPPMARGGSPRRALVQPGETVFGTPIGHAPEPEPAWRGAPEQRSPKRWSEAMEAAADRVVEDLHLPVGLCMSDIVATASAELGLPEPRDTKQGLIEVCSQLEIDTGERWAADCAAAPPLSPIVRPTTPTRPQANSRSPDAGSPDSLSHVQEDWFTAQGFSPTRSPRSSPTRSRSGSRSRRRRQDGAASTRTVQQHSLTNGPSAGYVSVEVSGDVRGLSLAVVSLDISSDVDASGPSPLANGSAEADAWYMGLKSAMRSAAFCAATNTGLQSQPERSSSSSTSRLVARQIAQRLEAREHVLFKESAKYTKDTLRVNVDLRACSYRRLCDSLVFVLFDSTMSAEPDVLSHACASNGRSPAGSHRPALTRKAQASIASNGCQRKVVEVTYVSDDAPDGPSSPYRGGLRVGGGFKHLRPPEVTTLEDRLCANHIQVCVRHHADEQDEDYTFDDDLTIASRVECLEWAGAVLMYAQPRSALWDQLLDRVRARRERRGAVAIQAVCRKMLERQQFLAHRYLQNGYQHMAVREWDLACGCFRNALGLRFIDPIVPALTQALRSADDSRCRRDLAREEVFRMLLEGNMHADSRQPEQALACYEAATAVRGHEDEALQEKLEHLRRELSVGAQKGASIALDERQKQVQTTRLQARTYVMEGNRRLADGDFQAATEAYQTAMHLAEAVNLEQASTGLTSDPLLHEVLEAVTNAQTQLATSSQTTRETNPFAWT